MTNEEIDAVLERVRTWPKDRLDQAVHLLLRLEELDGGDEEPVELSDEEIADIEEGLAQAERGEFATEEEVQAVFRRKR